MAHLVRELHRWCQGWCFKPWSGRYGVHGYISIASGRTYLSYDAKNRGLLCLKYPRAKKDPTALNISSKPTTHPAPRLRIATISLQATVHQNVKSPFTRKVTATTAAFAGFRLSYTSIRISNQRVDINLLGRKPWYNSTKFLQSFSHFVAWHDSVLHMGVYLP